MRLHDLSSPKGSRHAKKRLGRGNATGQGTTAGKGTKGQRARSGGTKFGFEGRSSREQRYGKRPGFTNIFRVEYATVKLSDLSGFDAESVIDSQSLREQGLIRGKQSRPVKILANGDVDKPLVVRVEKVTNAARAKLEGAGGRVEVLSDAASSA